MRGRVALQPAATAGCVGRYGMAAVNDPHDRLKGFLSVLTALPLSRQTERRMGFPWGLDLGSQNCVVAIARKGGIDVIDNEASSRKTP